MAEETGTEAATAHALIIGGGASGTTCALFLARAGITSTILDRGATTLRRAWLHNFPGFDAVMGPDWLEKVTATTLATGKVTFEKTKVSALGQDGETFFAETDGGRRNGDFIVLASGQGPLDYAGSLQLEAVPPVQPYVRTNLVVDVWGETSLAKVFAAGVLAGLPSQAVICAGSGANVAMRIASLVKGEFWVDHDSAPAGKE